MISLRAATPADVRAYAGRDLPDWCVRWVGHVAARDGEVVAVGLLLWDAADNLTAWVDEREPLPAILKHRLAIRTLAALRRCGTRHIAVVCDSNKNGAEMWLARLGFWPSLNEVTEYGQVWRCDLST